MYSQTLQDITGRIREAAARRAVLRIRGGGSKDFYGERLAGEVLDTRPLAGITSYEPSELVVTVRAGTPLVELEALLAQHGQCLPFEPPRFAAAAGTGGAGDAAVTVGGMVAAGLSGPSRASAGCVRDYVLGASLVNGKAELLSFGGTVMKNVAGYDVSRLIAGSMGTLALLTEVSLKVLPVAPGEATLRFGMDQAQALKAINDWGGQPLPLNASCWSPAGGGVLHVRLRGAIAAVEAARARMGGESVPFDWDALRDQAHPFFEPLPGMGLWRLSVAQSTPVLEIAGDTLIEWHGGLRWMHAPVTEASRIRQAALAGGGHATLWRTSGEYVTPVFTPVAAPLDRIHAALRQQFDPHGVFNTGRLGQGL
ncbi:MAG: glycolate oxidase subunit GlcE [Comamonadaceae bacterium]|nr:MAG: glycolate oxidase subunit GlcE [Comamonadaceae bacterium]